MRVPMPEREGPAPVLIVGVSFLLAFAGLLIFRSAPAPDRLAEWWPTGQGSTSFSAPAAAVQSGTSGALAPINARVGLQVGHWESANLPDELSILRTQTGANSGGYSEVDINYAVAHRVADLLRARGIAVDILPATIPPGYRADAFIALHCDANNDPGISGFKLARYGNSAIAARDDALLNAIIATYGPTTGLKLDGLISRAMIYYYAFNSQDFSHAIAPQTPAVILEMGFLTNDADRAFLVSQQPTVAQGVANGIVQFLSTR